MDKQSRQDSVVTERRDVEISNAVERCVCDKTGKKKTVIRGYAALFNSDSHDLGGFTERVLPGAFDGVMQRGTDVVALYNHEPMFLLGRESAGTLRLFVDEKGLRYEIDAPESRADVVEALERGEVRGSSFAFRVKPEGERWSRTMDGKNMREITSFDGLFDVGPVLRPAYGATEAFVSQRALEMAKTLSEPMVPSECMAATAARALELAAGTDALGEDIAFAKMVSERKELAPEVVQALSQWFAAAKPETRQEGSKARLSWELRGGDCGCDWAGSLFPESRDAAEEESGSEEESDSEESLSPANFALYEAIASIAVENGKWPQDGQDGVYYNRENPLAKDGVKCANCVFFNAPNGCDVVEGDILPDGVCKLSVVPESRLAGEEPDETQAAPADMPKPDAARGMAESAAAKAWARVMESLSHERK